MLPSSAQAQWTFDPNFAPSIIYPQVNNPCPNGNCGISEPRRGSAPKFDLKTPAKPTQQSQARLNFKPSLAVRRANLSRFLGAVRSNDSRAAAQLETMFSGDVFSAMGKVMAPYGLRIDNVADAYALYWISAWEASRGITTSNETKSRAQAVKQQAANALLATPEVMSATPEKKQEFAEALLLQTYLIAANVNGAKDNPAMMRQVSSAVAQGSKAMGLDLSGMTLTEKGFQPSETGAADPGVLDNGVTPETNRREDVQVASAEPARSNDKTPSYALIAAAGGAGIAGVFMLSKAMGKKG